MRAAIDNEIFVGLWYRYIEASDPYITFFEIFYSYSVTAEEGHITISPRQDLTASWGRAEPRVLAFDIECERDFLICRNGSNLRASFFLE